MYTIYADGELIYDSTVEDFKIGKGSGVLETNKAGSFTFSVYPEHFYYDRFVKKKTVILVKKSGKVLFRGRVLDDKVDLWNRREVICEGELNFLQDSIIRPYNFSGTPEEAFRKFVEEHNAQVDEFKRFCIGTVTVCDPNDYIARSNSGYESALKNLTSRLLEDSLGGYLQITHGDDGSDPVPTLHYLADFPDISAQTIEFGANLKDYLKKSTGQAIATAIIPLGAKIDDGNPETEDPRITIAAVNDGVDYVYDEAAVAEHGWIFDTAIFDDVTLPENLKRNGLEELAKRIREDVTLELTAVDLHLLDRSIESFRYNTYIRCISPPHNFAETLLCYRQTFNILKPDSDTVTLGNHRSSFAASAARTAAAVSAVPEVQRSVSDLSRKTAAYKIAEQQLTSLLAQSFGVFKTEEVLEDGSTVSYLHDKPTLAGSMNIWKMTGDAMAVSSDGGQTWNAGVDASGNAIYNILSVIGIDAEWINADNLSAISANIGGWEIKDDAIYKEYTEPSAGYIYRVYIRPPDSVIAAGDLSTQPLIEVKESTDDGETFHTVAELSAMQALFTSRLTETYNLIGSVSTSGFQAFNQRDVTSAFVTDKGLSLVKDAVEKGYFVTNGQYTYLMTDYINAKNEVYAPWVYAVSAYSGDIAIGGISFRFRGGILTDAYQY